MQYASDRVFCRFGVRLRRAVPDDRIALPEDTNLTHVTVPAAIPDDWVLSHDDLIAELRNPAFLLIDALSRESFAVGHIPGAINLPLADLRELARTALPDFDRPLAVYCSAFT